MESTDTQSLFHRNIETASPPAQPGQREAVRVFTVTERVTFEATFVAGGVTIGKTFHTSNRNGNSFGEAPGQGDFLSANLLHLRPMLGSERAVDPSRRLAFHVHFI